ncbi:MAG: glycosyltransferase family 4 protein, partial [Anaerolineae bacterium]
MSQTRTVLMLSNHGEIVGGGELSFLGLLKGLNRSRWAPIVVVPSDGAVAVGCRGLGLPTHVVPLPSIRWPGSAVLRSIGILYSLIKGTGAALLHANGSRAMFYAGFTGRLAGRRVIWHARVADRDNLLDRLLVSLAHAVIVNSRAVRRRFAWASTRKLHCIYNGIDLALFNPRQPTLELRASLGLPDGAPVVGSVGRFVAYKGYHHLLEAAG